jgi:hypothetical protein
MGESAAIERLLLVLAAKQVAVVVGIAVTTREFHDTVGPDDVTVLLDEIESLARAARAMEGRSEDAVH